MSVRVSVCSLYVIEKYIKLCTGLNQIFCVWFFEFGQQVLIEFKKILSREARCNRYFCAVSIIAPLQSTGSYAWN